MNKLQQVYNMPIPWAWTELSKMDVAIKDLTEVLELMPRGSKLHKLFAERIKQQLHMEKYPHYHVIVRMLGGAISGF